MKTQSEMIASIFSRLPWSPIWQANPPNPGTPFGDLMRSLVAEIHENLERIEWDIQHEKFTRINEIQALHDALHDRQSALGFAEVEVSDGTAAMEAPDDEQQQQQ